ncbi:MAG: formiminoglutamase, partial [Ekhidna sp.]
MDLKLFFDPIDIDEDKAPASFQSSIYINRHKMPDHEGMDIALIGLCEYRGENEKADSNSSNEVRKQLYNLKKGFGDYGIIDLGNFRNG